MIVLALRTTTFQASSFNLPIIVKPWNTICNLASPDKFSSLVIFKNFLRTTYFTLLDTTFDIDVPCTWFLSRDCPSSLDLFGSHTRFILGASRERIGAGASEERENNGRIKISLKRPEMLRTYHKQDKQTR